MDSLLLDCAYKTRVEAGGALAVDRVAFSKEVEKRLSEFDGLTIIRQEVESIPKGVPVIVATGPLTSDKLFEDVSYSEWQYQIDRVSADEEAKIVSGNIDSWAKECVTLASGIYADTPEGARVSYAYGAKYAPIVEQQLLKGGLRLASLLNAIYK